MSRPFHFHSRAGSLATRVLGSIALLVGIAVLFTIFVPNTTTQGPTETDSVTESQAISRKCEDDLADLIEAIAPGRLGISSDRITLINRLNTWQSECLTVGDTPAAGKEIEVAKQRLSGETLTRTLSEKFLPEDASHVRNSLLMRDIVTRITEGRPNNVERYLALFEFICRSQMLVPEEILKDFPLTPYESLVFGMGTSKHRAWAFCELLRQMRTDVVIISPQGEGLENHWLVGVIAPTEGVLLFDPTLGMPIPPLGETDADQKLPVATLAQVLESDEPFRKLDVPDSPYPLKSEDFKSIKVSVIGTSSSWAPRTAQLQFLLPSRFSCELYDGLAESELRSPGLLQRVVDAGQKGMWKEESVDLWEFSGEQLIAMELTRGEGAEGSMLATFHAVFRGPYVPHQTDDQGNYQMVPIDKSLHFVRVEQLQGNQVAAMKDFLPIRSAAKLAKTPANDLAAEYAALWTGVAQYETRKFTAAFNTFGRLVSTQASSTGILRSGIEWGANCLIAENEPAAAAKLLAQAPPGLAPRRDALLIRKWQRMAGIDPDTIKPEDAKPEAKPEMPAKEDTAKEDTAKPTGKPDEAPPEKSKEMPQKESPKESPVNESKPATPPKPEEKSSDKPIAEPETPKPDESPKPSVEESSEKPASPPESAESKPAEGKEK
ncbi:MAG TPA: hypothetical protein VNQ76_09115 [Planctomicrobium sp.]|nr:hypothetical protein [Planctomicrobium sp.]